MNQQLQQAGDADAVQKGGCRFAEQDDGGKFTEFHLGEPGQVAEEIVGCYREEDGQRKKHIKLLSLVQPADIFVVSFFAEQPFYHRASIVFGDQKRADGTQAVSYTHLDVYKRQSYAWRCTRQVWQI